MDTVLVLEIERSQREEAVEKSAGLDPDVNLSTQFVTRVFGSSNFPSSLPFPFLNVEDRDGCVFLRWL